MLGVGIFWLVSPDHVYVKDISPYDKGAILSGAKPSVAYDRPPGWWHVAAQLMVPSPFTSLMRFISYTPSVTSVKNALMLWLLAFT